SSIITLIPALRHLRAVSVVSLVIFPSYSANLSFGGLLPNILTIHSSFVNHIAPVLSSTFLAKVVLPEPINPQGKWAVGEFILFMNILHQRIPNGVSCWTPEPAN